VGHASAQGGHGVLPIMQWGYTCSSEEFEAAELVRFGRRADEAGFDFVTVSDHFHPWTSAQGHSPFVWSTLAALAACTDRVGLASGVTCPLIRTHPAIIAQAAATTSELSGGRFWLGVGTGEALNEHIVGHRWPAIETRQRMLVEAVHIIRLLWTGDTVDVEGEFFTIENARLFSAPTHPIDIVWAAAGERSARLAGEHADGLWCTSPSKDTVDAFRDAGGKGPVVGQLTLCWNPDEAAARATALRQWPNSALRGQLAQDLPTWSHFEDACALVTEDDVAREVLCGADVDQVVDAVREYVDAGVDRLHFHQVGPDQDVFIRAFADRLRDRLPDGVRRTSHV
jgi:coenzyme F420-dependent glucose-6-phosphate dehydrogenase